LNSKLEMKDIGKAYSILMVKIQGFKSGFSLNPTHSVEIFLKTSITLIDL